MAGWEVLERRSLSRPVSPFRKLSLAVKAGLAWTSQPFPRAVAAAAGNRPARISWLSAKQLAAAYRRLAGPPVPATGLYLGVRSIGLDVRKSINDWMEMDKMDEIKMNGIRLDSIAVSVFVLSFTCIYLSLTNTDNQKQEPKKYWLVGELACLVHTNNLTSLGNSAYLIFSDIFRKKRYQRCR